MTTDVKDQQKDGKKSILQLIIDEEKKAKRDAAKAKAKSLFSDLVKARAVADGIEDQIVSVLADVGETEAEIRAMLSGE